MTQKEGMLYQNAYPLFCCKRLSGGQFSSPSSSGRAASAASWASSAASSAATSSAVGSASPASTSGFAVSASSSWSVRATTVTPVGLAQAHDPDAAAVAALDGDVRRVHPNDDALLAAEQDVVGVVHDLDAGDFILAGVVVADALAAAAGQAVVLDLGAAALALLGDGQDGGALAADGDAHHLVAFLQADGAEPPWPPRPMGRASLS